MRTVIRLLHEGAAAFGNEPYLGEKTGQAYETVSFRDTDRLSDAFAAALVKRGLCRGRHIALLSEGRSAWVIGEFGVLKAGCVSVPLSTKLLPEEILFRLVHSEAAAVLVSQNNFEKLDQVYSQLTSRPAVICISGRNTEMDIMASRAHGIQEVLYFEELVTEGQDDIANNTEIEGTSVVEALEQIEAGIHEDDTVTISYTSGTTGNPKGIMLTHLNYWDNAHAAAELVTVERGWKSLIMLPLDHSFAHTVGLYIFLYRGLTMYFVDARGGPMGALRNLPKNLLEVNPDFLLTVPALSGNFMKKMVQGISAKGPFISRIFQKGLAAGIARAGDGFTKPPLGVRFASFFPWFIANILIFPKLRAVFGRDIKFCIGGGALLEIKQQEFFNAIGVPIYQGYGLTENAPIICTNAPKKHKFGTSGAIIPSLDVRIMKDEDAACTPGEVGQIVTRGDSVMKGYYKNEEATAEVLKVGWLWSGDLGYIDSDGFLVVTGREKALLIAADGEKYSPETIEEAIINTSRYVHQVMAYNEQSKFTGVLVTLDTERLKQDLDHGPGDPDTVIDLVRKDLCVFHTHPDYADIPSQWRPSSFVIIPEAFSEDHGLVNSTMKLVRHKVREHYRDRIEEMYATGTADPHFPGNREALKALGF
ncbi:MAG: AMP-binding protein [Spirochaetales bacterium]|nr:AMP-binding protein [Spirochaetales bacterium]